MIELFFVTCLISNPDRCTEHSLLFEPRNGLQSCMLSGQHELARWVATHPGDWVKSWECRHAGARDTAI